MSSDQLKAQGNAAFSAGKFQEAIDFFTQAIAVDPKNHVLYSNRSASYASLRNYEKALTDADMTIKIKPDWAKGYSRKGAALQGAGRLEEAVQVYKKGLDVEPSNQQLKDSLQEVEQEMKKSMENPFGKLFGPEMWGKLATNPKTAALLQQPDFLEKLRALQANPQLMNMYLQDPRMMEALSVLLGINMQAAGGDDEDTPAPQPKPESKPQPKPEPKPEPVPEPTPEPEQEDEEMDEEEREARKKKALAVEAKQKGNELYKKRQFADAIAQYTLAIENDPSEITYYTNRAAVYFETKEYQKAIEDCEKGIEVGRAARADYALIAKAYARIANSHVNLGDLNEAIKFFNKSLSENRAPDVLKRLKEIEKLKEQRDKEAYIDPVKSQEEKQKGNECFKQGKNPEAVAHYTEAIKRNPKDHVLYSNRAAAYMKLGEYRLGLQDAEEAIKIEPTFTKALIRKAHCLYFMKEYQKALEAYDTILKIEPDNEEVTDGVQRTLDAMNKQGSNESEEDVMKRVAKDPEAQAILSDPNFRIILQQIQENPRSSQEYLRDPEIARKIQKLVSLGVIKTR
eukprot:TRINITY_DN2805_c0_g1_i1.p1 TRINITY_DN2805_c0_g1~~TRINITY_DN2805_c0_g1_i1.p1  ORF type:complete len:569 (+),score=168.32 TRINITY_DN2805_c0_g1_i1:83-1789(+)